MPIGGRTLPLLAVGALLLLFYFFFPSEPLLDVRTASGSVKCPAGPSLPGSAPSKVHIASAFDAVYSKGLWGKEGRGSGDGSSLAFTQGGRAYLEKFVRRNRIRTFADVPCGSAHWIPPLLEAIRKFQPCFAYLGLDVVRTVIEENRRGYGDDPLVRFEVADVSQQPLPRVDMILSRDALQHLPLADAINVLENIARAQPKFLVVGSYVSRRNKNVAAGGYYDIDLLAPPFNLPSPSEITPECCNPTTQPHPQKYFYTYTTAQLRTFDFKAMRKSLADDMVNGAFGPDPSLLAAFVPPPNIDASQFEDHAKKLIAKEGAGAQPANWAMGEPEVAEKGKEEEEN
ncbi:hypothetical protein DFJ74DRAFT_56848 [Hyaloraphidium curvatum]|nr:hypothetical protein DFJ74DRAFT_56848 [Hyaloraphidium curvatum]